MAGSSFFGKYQLLAQLGEGGMAEVFLAIVAGPRGLGFSKLTVVKRLRATFDDDPELITMLVDEARIAARLNHPNVVQTHEVGDVEGKYFLSMEYLDGQSFNRVQNRAMAMRKSSRDDSSVKPSELTKEMEYVVVLDVLAGLHHAHELTDYDGSPVAIVHRDITPQNVFITYDGQVKVVDFGIAQAEGRGAKTRHGVIKGKIRYMAPEQALGRAVDRRADIFSVGVLLWEAATGERRWKDQPDAEIVSALVSPAAYVSPRDIDPTVPIEIDTICRKALAPDPDDRYQTAEELRLALAAFLDSTGKLTESRAKLGSVVSAMFSDKRAELKRIIEKQLFAVSSQAGSDLTPMMLTLHGSERELSSRRMLKVEIGETETAAHTAGGSPTTAKKRPLPLLLAAVAGLVLVGVLIFRGRGGDGSPKTTGAIAKAASEPSSPISVSISASPAAARIFVDGTSVFSPYETKHERSPAPHVVRIEADGYETQTKEVVFDRDLTLLVALNKASVAAPERSAPASRPAAAAAPPSFAFAAPKPAAPPRTASADPVVAPAPVSPPSSPVTSTAAPSGTARKKDIDRSNPFSGTSSGAGPTKSIDKTNPFAQ